MASETRTGMIQTVTGTINPEELGLTLTHEHLLIDISVLDEPPIEASARSFYYKPVSQETLGYIRHHAFPNRDNSQLLDLETAMEEAALYKQFGGNSLVDATSIGIARDPKGLVRISRSTDVNVIMTYRIDLRKRVLTKFNTLFLKSIL